MRHHAPALLLFCASVAGAADYAVGDRVEASPMGLDSRWESCTVVAVDSAKNVTVACGERKTEYVVGGRWIRRPSAAPAGSAARPTDRRPAPAPSAGAANPRKPAVPPPVDRAAAEKAGCDIGAEVVDRAGKRGRIVGVANGMCEVQLDAGGRRPYLAWMLSPSGAAAEAGGNLPPGVYTCSAPAAGQFKITIQDGGRYLDRAGSSGRYSLDPATKVITFSSGSLRGQYSQVLGPGKFGLSSETTTMFYTVCNRT